VVGSGRVHGVNFGVFWGGGLLTDLHFNITICTNGLQSPRGLTDLRAGCGTGPFYLLTNG